MNPRKNIQRKKRIHRRMISNANHKLRFMTRWYAAIHCVRPFRNLREANTYFIKINRRDKRVTLG